MIHGSSISGAPSGGSAALGLVAAIEQNRQTTEEGGEPRFDAAGNITTLRDPIFHGTKTAFGVYP
jgi:hypothetical protein